MKPFHYHRPEAAAAAVALAGEESRFLAGGMTLLPTMKQRLVAPAALVDLSGLDALLGIREKERALEIGAMTTHAAVASSELVRSRIAALARLAGGIGDPAVRNRGTIGGSLANNDPAADYPAGALGLGATILTDRRTIPADDFFVAMFTTALEPDELITAVRFPVPLAAAYAKFRSPASRYALAGVFVARFPSGVRVAVTGAAAGVFRATGFEKTLEADFSPGAIDSTTIDAADMLSDMHAEAEYRAHLVAVMARRAVAEAAG
jgi:carbon-monoxide dehydrogenase medium subunit